MHTNILHFFLIGLTLNTTSVLAVSEDTGVKLDWGTHKAKVFGEASYATSPDAKDWKALERAAWQDAFKKIESYYLSDAKFKDVDKQTIRDLVRKHTLSVNTFYYGAGSVRIQFENAYSEALLASAQSEHSSNDASPSRNSGLIFRVKGAFSPTATYRIISESGEELFSSKSVSKEGFSKNLMGKFLSPNAKNGLQAVVGENPADLSFQVKDADLVIAKSEWQAQISGNQSLLTQARIAIIIKP